MSMHGLYSEKAKSKTSNNLARELHGEFADTMSQSDKFDHPASYEEALAATREIDWTATAPSFKGMLRAQRATTRAKRT